HPVDGETAVAQGEGDVDAVVDKHMGGLTHGERDGLGQCVELTRGNRFAAHLHHAGPTGHSAAGDIDNAVTAAPAGDEIATWIRGGTHVLVRLSSFAGANQTGSYGPRAARQRNLSPVPRAPVGVGT